MRLFPILLFISFLSQAQTNIRYPSLLWKISGNGLTKTSYLYGTMHVSNRVAWHLSDEFFDALRSSDLIGLETNPAEWLDNMEKTGELAEISRPRQSANFQTNFYKNIFRQTAPERKILQAVISYDPDIINGLLYRQNRSQENFEENTYVDLFIFQSASKLNKKVISLENFTEAEISARLSAVPDEDQSETRGLSYFGTTQKIEDAYRDGNLDLLDSLSKMTSSRNAQKYLINERNRAFVNTIDSVIRKNSLFSGVGAAHLPGEEGVIELLRKKGYTVEPVKARHSRKSSVEKDKLSDMLKPLVFSPAFAPDSSFSVDLPGKLYPIFESPALRYYIHPDMVNGHFYTVVRLRHMGPLFGISRTAMMQRVDSLLFENIPGRIISKEPIKTEKDQAGFELICRTANGNQQRYRFYFNDAEMLIFKLGARDAYASGREAARFFNSIRFRDGNSGTVRYSPPAGGFSISIPAQYNYFADNAASGKGLVEDLYALQPATGQVTGVQHAVYNDFNYLEEDTFELRRLAASIVENYKFSLQGQYTLGKEKGLPSVRFTGFNARKARMDARVIIKGVHYYFVFTVTPDGQTPDFSGFDSFTLGDFRYLHPLKKITDADMLFTAQDEVTADAASRFNEQYNKRYKEAFDSTRKNTEAKGFRSFEKVYYSPSANEYVNILFEKYDEYDYRDRKEVESKIDHSLGKETGMRLTAKKTQTVDGRWEYLCDLKDTATSRAIRVRIIMKNSVLHQLSAPYDTIAGFGKWTGDFLRTFTPMDSAAGPDIFKDKTEQLFSDLLSQDTALRRRTGEAIENTGLHRSQAPALLKLMQSADFGKISSDSRAQLLVNGGTIHDSRLIPAYRELYKQYTDSFYLQMCVLKGLAYMKTQESFRAFTELLTGEPPLVGDEGLVTDVFSELYDSLQLCRSSFPALLSLSRYDEFRNPVYILLSEMLGRKLITASSLQSKLPDITADAILALKRYNSQKTNKQEDAEIPGIEEITEILLAGNNEEQSQVSRSILDRSAPVAFGMVLSHFYQTDQKARQVCERILKLKDPGIVMPVTVALMKNQVRVPDTLVASFCRKQATRPVFFAMLEKEGLQKNFSGSFNNQESINLALASNHFLRDSEGERTNNDSLLLFTQLKAANRYQRGTLYVYKHSKLKNGESRWHALFVSENNKTTTARIEIPFASYYPDPQKSEAENLSDLQDQFSLLYRKRAGISSY